ncbi:MAG TPA: AraC family transcriptional regulator ligand-binding domain-containing protein [Acidobacteriota bacterium]|nr:AraC family transcriptional regulator ligand-binding domain-containing protein [Acidobacteriota bacterium]
MSKKFRVSSQLARRLEELGLSPADILRRAALPAATFSRDKIYITTEELFSLWRTIAEVSTDPAIALRLGSEERIERYDPIAIAALYTRSFRDAIERMSRYKQLTCPEQIKLTEKGSESTIQFKWMMAKEQEPPLLIDLCFAWIVSIARRGTGSALSPVRVEFQRSSGNRELYTKHFGCAVKFKSNRNALIFNKADLDRPFVTYNAELLGIVAPQLELELKQQLSEESTRDHVKANLKLQLAGKRPSMLQVARELNMSRRSLQRRLAEEGATFQRLLEDARRELAHHYLEHSSLELSETAYLLGYENSNSFLRAFHTWEGTSPGKWRAQRSER